MARRGVRSGGTISTSRRRSTRSSRLINHLCDSLGIPRRVPARFLDYYGESLRDFQGVIGHSMVRADKTDPLPDVEFWEKVVAGCNLELVGAR